MKTIKIIVCTIILGVFATSALAARIVYDPKNAVHNVLTAKTSLKIEVEQVKQRIQQYKQLKTMYENLKKLDPKKYEPQIKDVVESIGKLDSYNTSLGNVNKALGDQESYLQNVQQNYAMSGTGKLEDYLSVLKRRSESGNIKAKQLMDMSQNVHKNLAVTAKRRGELQLQTQNSDGALQSSQTTNQYLDVIVSQNAEITALLAESTIDKAESKKIDSLNSEKLAKNKKEFDTLKEKSFNNIDKRWGSK